MNSIRIKLLFWFIILLFLQIISITIINSLYHQKQSRIDKLVTEIYHLNNDILRVINLSSQFFRNEINNPKFFKSGESIYIDNHQIKYQNTYNKLRLLDRSKVSAKLELIDEINILLKALTEYDSLFNDISTLLKERGYKDYGYVGNMQKYARALEKSNMIDKEAVFHLRRHEKDYFISNEISYVLKLNKLAKQLENNYKNKTKAASEDSVLIFLENYQDYFNKTVRLDNQIGLRSNIGLKKQLDIQTDFIEAQINQIVRLANNSKDKLYVQNRINYISLFISSIIMCILLSTYISKKLTKPLKKLSNHIVDFVTNDFKQNSNLQLKNESNEIARINEQFNFMANSLELREQERNKALLSLSSERKRYRQLAELLPLSIFETNSNGTLTYVNKTWLEKFKYETWNWDSINLKDIYTNINDFESTWSKKCLDTFEFLAKRSDGKSFPALLYVNAIESGKNAGGLRGIVVDITDRVKYIKVLRREKERAEESDRLKSAFLANMSHEIRTPLNGILGFSELLVNCYEETTETEVYINQIRESSNLLLKVINDLIDLAKIETGKIEIKEKEVDMDKVMSDTYIFYQNQLKKNNQNVKIHLAKISSEPIKFYSDEKRIKQVLFNLIDNAIKFTNIGDIKIAYELNSNEIIISVNDTGIGISEENQKVIFDRFRQANETIRINYGGSGLGLTISKQIIERLGGKINLNSEIGSGSCFFITLPNKKSETVEVPNIKSSEHYNLQEKTLLIVEDDDSSFLLIKAFLRNTEANIIRSKNGRQAIDKVMNNNNIDLIIMDIQMPVMNGIEATKIIKSMQLNIPIIIQTSHAMVYEQEKALTAGADDFITKPIDKIRLLDKINYHLVQNTKPSFVG